MKMRKTPGKLMLGVGLTAAAVAMTTPIVRNMVMNRSSRMSSDKNYNSLQ